ncbi:hypothetical protein BDN72DRAFT_749441, partial [Pluteus cervinus]
PNLSTFIRFSIDPIAAVEGVDDSEVQRAAREMKPKHYIACVRDLCSWDISQPSLVYKLKIIGCGFPDEREEKGIESNMCTPIFPAISHPGGREPLRTNPPFPFDDCY